MNERWATGTNSYTKSTENRLRRIAKRQGLILRKDRRRDRRATDYGTWYLERVDQEGVHCLVEARDLNWIADYLNEPL